MISYSVPFQKLSFMIFSNISNHCFEASALLVILTDKKIFKGRESYVVHIFSFEFTLI